jgi:phage-related protein
MAATRKLTVEVLGDAKGAQGAFKELASGTDSLGKQFTDFGKKVGATFVAAAAGTALFARSALDAAYEAQKVSSQTDAIIKATGKAAGLTGDQVQQLADSLSYKTGVDDEAIQSSMNMLLTFKQVRNEMGKGNDIFGRASSAMLDLGNVFGSSESAAMQLGKALSDPVKGISALRRAGVNFTDAQKDQIKAFVESGDLLSAQKMILTEVESQVGGTAAATATSAARMKVAFENLQERMGALLLPVFEKFARLIVEKVIPAIERFVDRYGPTLISFFKNLWKSVQPVLETLTNFLLPIFKKIGSWMADNTTVVATFFGVLAGIATIASLAALAGAIASLFNPITLIIGAIALVAAGFVYAYKHFETFRQIVDSVAGFIINTVVPAIATAFGWLKDQITSFVNGVRSRWEDIRAATENVFGVIHAIVATTISALQWMWNTLV